MPSRLSRKRRASQTDDNSDVETPAQSRDESRRSSPVGSDLGVADTQVSYTSWDELSKRLVRYALACESQRRPLRRQEISEKVLGNHGRQFKKVFAQAQGELEAVFGMRMTELPARDRLTLAQRRAAQQKSSTQKPQTVSWIMTSTLPAAYHDSSILPPSAIPDEASESTYTSIYTVLVALVFLNGSLLTETRLERYLSRLGLDETTPVAGYEKTDKLLKRMERDGYLVKVREPIGTSGEEEVSWGLGSRGKVEIGREGVKGLVETVYGVLDDDARSELGRKIERSLGPEVTSNGVDSQSTQQALENRRNVRPGANRAQAGHNHNDDDGAHGG